MKLIFEKFLCCFFMIILIASFVGCGDNVPISSAETDDKSAFSRIAGTWREDAEDGTNVLCIDEDGSYVLYHTSGGTERGSIVIEDDEYSDETYDSWFSFYDESGALWTGFQNMKEYAENPPYELISESVDRMKYVRIDDNEKTPAKDYVGVWVCGKFTIRISKAKKNYKVNIIWGSSAFESSEWNYNCRYDKETASLVCKGGASLVNHKCNEKGKEKKTTVYKNGSGSFTARGGVLRWTDNKEDAGKDMYFSFSPVQE